MGGREGAEGGSGGWEGGRERRVGAEGRREGGRERRVGGKAQPMECVGQRKGCVSPH